MVMRVFERRVAPARRSSDVHAKRIAALWRIATGASDEEQLPVEAILAEAAAVVRPAQPFLARLARASADGLEVIAAAGAGMRGDVAQQASVGSTVAPLPLEEAAAASGTARSGESLDGRWRSAIAAPLRVGSTDYVLGLLSPDPSDRPFDRDDELFVELVAAYLERALRERWHAERLRFQMQHDPLTGLVNRTRFRALLQAALHERTPCGVAVVDLVGLAEVNERLGYMTGDALLVEIGATLAGMNRDGEFTGRLYGDSFGIGFPNIDSPAALERRLAAYANVFAAPFGTGDREGRERVRVDARLGSAVAPQDGTTADALLERARSES